jgi:hypothetical protein
MSTFDSTKTQLSKLLEDINDGKIQLPDFQRGWVWDDDHIRELLVSIARSFPIGAVMLLETGGAMQFQMRPIEGVRLPEDAKAELLILDGQQRLTSLTQVLKLTAPVATRDRKKRELLLHYYFDIEKAMLGPQSLGEAIVVVDETRQLRSDFGRRVDLDLSTTEKEIEAFCCPCSQALDSSDWEYALRGHSRDKLLRFMDFRKRVLQPFRDYMLPIIELKKQTSKEAVCLVFEKVNTGGVSLSVFDLITATWAAEGFNLREAWAGPTGRGGIQATLHRHDLLRGVQATDFLQGISLLFSHQRRRQTIAESDREKDWSPVSAKREDILEMPLAAYQRWAKPLTDGFLLVDEFLRAEGFHHQKFLPYRSQLPPLAAVLSALGDRWMEPKIRDKLARWFWSGVLGELYGGAVETRIALDMQQLHDWIHTPGAPEPGTVQGAGFQANRLDTLRSRTSAAYRGLYVLLQREGARDFFFKARMVDLDKNRSSLDIHHIFPRKWCEDRGVPPRVYNAIVNKTAISYKANRMIGGKSPSAYLKQIQEHASVQAGSGPMDEIIASHQIDASLLRADDFEAFYQARKRALLRLVEAAMGKGAVEAGAVVPEDDDDDEGGEELTP